MPVTKYLFPLPFKFDSKLTQTVGHTRHIELHVSRQTTRFTVMAEAWQFSGGGYNEEFVNPVEEDLQCSICHLPLKEAVQTGICGHRFCKQCLDEHFIRLVFVECTGRLIVSCKA